MIDFFVCSFPSYIEKQQMTNELLAANDYKS